MFLKAKNNKNKDDRREKKDYKRKCYNDRRKTKNNADDNTTLNAKPDVNSDVDFVKPRKIKKKVSTNMKSNLNKIADLKLMNSFVTNYLVNITSFKNLTFHILDKAGIAAINFLVNVMANSFDIIFPVNLFVVFISSFIKNISLDILIVANLISSSAKSFINIFDMPVSSSVIILIGFSIEADTLNNFFADVLFLIKSFMGLALNITYKKWSKYTFYFVSVILLRLGITRFMIAETKNF